jgi:polysaccharide biosynthesis protein PslG
MIDPRDTASPFGVLDFLSWDHDWNQFHSGGGRLERTLDLMQEAGVAILRTDFLWVDIEPRAGVFEFAKYDRLVREAGRRGIKVLGLLLYNCAWNGRPWNAAPDPIAFARYARRVVNRYKEQICHWELWNEPDHSDYWQPQDLMRSYTELLKQVYAQLKDEDRTCVVHLAGLTKALPASLRRIYDLGGKSFFDVAHLHPFINPLAPEALLGLHDFYQVMRNVMSDYGDRDKPVWFSEVGCPGLANPKSVPDWWLGPNPTEEQQAGWLRQVYTEALAWPGLQKAFWCFFRDTPNHFKTGVDSFGLVRTDFSVKPAFQAFETLAKTALVPAVSDKGPR